MSEEGLLQNSGVAELPATIAALVQDALAANRGLARHCLSHWLTERPPTAPQLVQLGKIGFHWNLSMVRSKQRVLFGFRRRYGSMPIMKTKLSMDLTPVPAGDLADASGSRELLFRLALPRFVLVGLRPAQKKMFLSTLGRLSARRKKKALFFAVGPGERDVLTVVPRLARFGDPPRFQYTPADGQPYKISKNGSGWPLDPFMAFFHQVIRWITSSADEARLVPLAILFGNQGSGVQQILRAIATIWRKGNQSTAVPEGSALFDLLKSDYLLENYRSHILLRINRDGDLTSEDRGQVFQLRLRTDMVKNDGQTIFRAFLTIPDFLVRLRMRNNVLAPFLTGRGLTALEKEVGGHSLKEFMLQAKETAFTFRTGRLARVENNRWSKNVFGFYAPFDGTPYVLIFKAKLRKQNPELAPEESEFEYSGLQILYFGEAVAGQSGFDDEVIEYVGKLANSIGTWVEAIL